MIIHGDCLEKLKKMPGNSVDSVVTDPPYGLKFMGKKWDYDVPNVEIWLEVLRVLKPGGHLLSFGGTRTYHRMVVAIEDAGFEIRDQLSWLYGSGFPKSHDISKAIDKLHGAEREVVGRRTDRASSPIRDNRGGNYNSAHGKGPLDISAITAPATPEAKQWQGWGSALKPAHEPIVLARKPLDGTLAQNTLKWGVGGLNIDAGRIGTDDVSCIKKGGGGATFHGQVEKPRVSGSTQGRFPANLLLDEVAAEMLDAQSGPCKTGTITKVPTSKDKFFKGKLPKVTASYQEIEMNGASRFFYVAKASKRERGEGNYHPTVKPIKLMEYLIKLVTPPNGTVLDPFTGSGSTGIAAKKLGFKFIGIELNQEYCEIAQRRMGVAK